MRVLKNWSKWMATAACGAVLTCGMMIQAEREIIAAPTSGRLTGGPPQSATDASDGVYLRTILLRPKSAEQSLRTTLFPSRHLQQPGSAAPIFLRQNFEATHSLTVLRETYARKDWEASLDDLDVKAIRAGTPLRWSELRRAAFRERAGWEYPIQEERMAYILLPDVQESRIYLKAILLAARADLKESKINEATDKICIAMGLARHIGETPFAVCRVSQHVQVGWALQVIEELLQHPQSENQFWALNALPRPMIAVQDAVQLESHNLARTFPMLAASDARLTEEDWKKVAGEVLRLLAESGAAFPKEETPEAQRKMREWIDKSRERLPRVRPDWKDRVATMSDAEVGVRYWFERTQARTTRHLALATLEYPQALKLLAEDEVRLNKDSEDESPLRQTEFRVLPLVRAAALTDQRIGLLRTIEAIRDWSAAHKGELPPALSDLRLPVPLDCVTQAPFTYTIDAARKTATLEGAPIVIENRQADGRSTLMRRGFRYELVVGE